MQQRWPGRLLLAIASVSVLAVRAPPSRAAGAGDECHTPAGAPSTVPAAADGQTAPARPAAAAAALAAQRLAEGARQFGTADYAGAVERWGAAERLSREAGDPRGRVHALENLGAAHLRLGNYRLASDALNQALALARANDLRREAIAALSARGAVWTCVRRADDAAESLDEAAALAEREGGAANDLLAAVLNNRANLSAMRAGGLPDAESKAAYERAAADYRRSASLAHQAGDATQEAKALANAARTFAYAGRPDDAERENARAVRAIAGLAECADKVHLLIESGQTDYRVATAAPDVPATPATQPATAPSARRPDLIRRAYAAFAEAARLAGRFGDDRARSFALGHAARLYEAQGRAGEALALTRRAAAVAQQARLPDVLYRWQWQAGRLLRDEARRSDNPRERDELTRAAITAYTNATGSLQAVRSDVALGYGNAAGMAVSFREAVGPLYTELADLLLRRAAGREQSEPAQAQRDLAEARATVELLKAGELEDYFQDDCVNQVRQKRRELEQVIEPGTAVVYLIPLPDRTELLVSTAGGEVRRFASAATAAQVNEQAEQLAFALQDRSIPRGYLRPASRLYEWLIRPAEAYLQSRKVDTLVFVPDGALRTVPAAALYDARRKQYLIEQYAVAVTPGLSLVAPTPLGQTQVRVLGSGISQPVEGFDPLPAVAVELDNLRRVYGERATTLQDEQFTRANLRRAINAAPFSVVHIASHGEFAPDAGRSFILVSDGHGGGERLNLDQLQKIIQPRQFAGEGMGIELLTLSACETAAGNDRAALGLAGVAVKAGARSAVATLWSVEDEASAELMTEFYRVLKEQPGLSKAKAMRLAQLALLRGDPAVTGGWDKSHAYYWSPFLVIGNWR